MKTTHMSANCKLQSTARVKAPAGAVAESHTLDRIQGVTGVLRAYDGRYCVWGSNGPFDVRDIGNRVGLSMQDVLDALPDFTPAKRGRASLSDEG